MADFAKSDANVLAENHGQNLDAGTERTSATAPASRSIAIKRSGGKLEWPMVRRSKAVMVS